jgi:uncharacterized protein (DUF1330 family)
MIFVGTLGLLLGALSASVLSAATPAPKAYLIANITDITNPEMLKEYQAQAPAINAAFGGQVLVRGKAVQIGSRYTAPTRTIVLLQFPDMKHLFAWYNSPAYAKIRGLRENSSTTHEFAVAALPMR